jgi:hypothetical protein
MLKFVEIKPTSHSVRNGFDLSLMKENASAGWAVSDLTREELVQIGAAIIKFLGS